MFSKLRDAFHRAMLWNKVIDYASERKYEETLEILEDLNSSGRINNLTIEIIMLNAHLLCCIDKVDEAHMIFNNIITVIEDLKLKLNDKNYLLTYCYLFTDDLRNANNMYRSLDFSKVNNRLKRFFPIHIEDTFAYKNFSR